MKANFGVSILLLNPAQLDGLGPFRSALVAGSPYPYSLHMPLRPPTNAMRK